MEPLHKEHLKNRQKGSLKEGGRFKDFETRVDMFATTGESRPAKKMWPLTEKPLHYLKLMWYLSVVKCGVGSGICQVIYSEEGVRITT